MRSSIFPRLRVAAGSLLTIVLLLGSVQPGRASVSAGQTFQAPFVRAVPPIDPSLTSPIWQQGIVATDFKNVLTKGPAGQTTRAWVLFGLNAMYVGIQCDQPDQKITTDPRQQGFGQADFAGVGIDPSGNGQNVYYFGATPTGNQYVLNSRSATYSPSWTARSTVSGTGWSTIIVIPYDILVMPPTQVQRWRFNIVRHVAETNDDLTWAYDPLMTIPSGNQGAASVGNFGGGGSAQAQAQQNALNAQAQGVNPLGLVIWPTTSDAQYWPVVTGKVPATLLPAFNVAGGIMFPEGVDRNKYYQLGNAGSYVPQGIPYASYLASYRLTPDVEVAAENTEFPIMLNSAQPGVFQVRPFFISGGNAFSPGRSIPTSTLAGPDLVIAPWNIGEINQAYKIDGSAGGFGRYTFDVMNVVGQGFNDSLFGVREDLPRQTFSWWFDGALTHHGAGYLGLDTRQGFTQTGELGFGGRNPKTGLAYVASYAQQSGAFPTYLLPLGQTIDPGLATKTELVAGLEQPFYSVHAIYTDIGPQFSPADGTVNLAGVRGFALEATTNGSGGPKSWLKQYYVRGYGTRQFDPSGAVVNTDDEVSAAFLTKNDISMSAGELLTTRAAYAFATPVFPQLTGYPVNYIGRVYEKLGDSAVMLGYRTGSPAFIEAAYVFGPNALGTFVPPGIGNFINGYQQTYTVLGQKQLLGFTLQAAYGINRGYYPGTEATLYPGGQTQGQTLRFASISRNIDAYTGFILGYQSVVGSPTGASAPDTYFSATFVQNLKRNAGQFSVSYGSPPRAPFFIFPRAVANWNFPSSVIGCLAGNGLCNLNRLTVNYERNVSF